MALQLWPGRWRCYGLVRWPRVWFHRRWHRSHEPQQRKLNCNRNQGTVSTITPESAVNTSSITYGVDSITRNNVSWLSSASVWRNKPEWWLYYNQEFQRWTLGVTSWRLFQFTTGSTVVSWTNTMRKQPIEYLAIAFFRRGVETRLYFMKRNKEWFVLTPRRVKRFRNRKTPTIWT